MDKPVYISICNQKGGVGKTSFTLLLASSLCYERGMNVAVLDCDYPQHSSYKYRQWEIGQIKNSPYYNRRAEELFNRIGRPIYPIISTTPEEALVLAEKMYSTSDVTYDVILFDLPGTVNNQGVLDILEEIDYYFTPIEASYQVLESSLNFACVISESLERRGCKDQIYLFWNKVDKREKNDLYDLYEERVIKRLKLPLLQSRFPLSSRFRKGMDESGSLRFLVSSVFPATAVSVRDTNIDVQSFTNEIYTIINKNGKETINKG